MLYWLSDVLVQVDAGFGVFRYLTLRIIMAMLTALLLSLLCGPLLIRWLERYQVTHAYSGDRPATHAQKQGTPTMGGVLILLSILAATLSWADPGNRFVWVAMAVTVAFGIVGCMDDRLKVIRGRGLCARTKFVWLSMASLVFAVWLFSIADSPAETALILPFIKEFNLQMGIGYIVLAYLVIVGSSNAVNLTDGLDGLAIMPTVLIAAAFAVFAYVAGHATFSEYLHMPFVPGAGELAVFCGAIVGGGVGFLWFNTYPAQVFMGDVGALALGAALGAVAIMVRQEFVLFIMGGLFVAEAVSVIVQVGTFKFTGRRVLLMAPFHHHFEKQGWAEPKIVVRLWIVSMILVLIGLASLKIR